MNITLLIGNGFDIACNLRTSYKHFIQDYLATPTSDIHIKEFKDHIVENFSTWADAEFAFGSYSSRYSKENLSVFRKCYDHFLNSLLAYFETEENKVDFKKLDAAAIQAVKLGFLFLEDELTESSQDAVINYFKSTQDIKRTFNFIVFNYTNTFEKFINAIRSGNDFGSIRNVKTFENYYGTLLYAHGKRSQPPVIFGVNDDQQIANADLLTDLRFKRSFLKPVSNKLVRQNILTSINNVLDNSSVICIYGMSLGVTDNYWWMQLGAWLKKSDDHLLIVYMWDENCIKCSVGSCLDSMEDNLELVYSRLFQKDTNIITVSVKKRIHIAINADLFSMKKVQKSIR